MKLQEIIKGILRNTKSLYFSVISNNLIQSYAILYCGTVVLLLKKFWSILLNTVPDKPLCSPVNEFYITNVVYLSLDKL